MGSSTLVNLESPFYVTATALQVLHRAVEERNMRVRGVYMESEKLRKHLAKQGAVWGNLQHDLGCLRQVPEAKGQRQQVGCVPSALLGYDTLVTVADWTGCDGRSILCAAQWGYGMVCHAVQAVPGLTGRRHKLLEYPNQQSRG